MSTKAKKILLGSLIVLVSFLYSSSPEENCNCCYKAGYPAHKNCMLQGYNVPGRIDVCGSKDYFLSLRFLYWQPKEQGLDIALVSPTYNQTADAGHNLNTHFDYHPGFKITLGLFLSYDSWGIWADYTSLHTQDKAGRKADPQKVDIINYWKLEPSTNNSSFISSRAAIDQDFLDLSLGRPYYLGTMVIFNPYLGLRMGWIDQSIRVIDQEADSFYKTKVSSDSWILGPRIGIEMDWLLADGFRFFGEAFSSFFYQDFKVSAKEIKGQSPSASPARDRFGSINGSLDLSIGLGWGKYFCCQKLHVDALAGYELEILWNQNRMRTFIEELKSEVYSKPGNLTPHGFIFALRLDF